ncbi:hypothetical protein CLOP_g12495, partial [Closterium sp. NIES-67]
LSFGCKFAAVGATFLRVEEDISCTPPYAERTCTGLGAGPQFSGSDGRPKRVRVKVVQQRGMKEGVTPKGSCFGGEEVDGGIARVIVNEH